MSQEGRKNHLDERKEIEDSLRVEGKEDMEQNKKEMFERVFTEKKDSLVLKLGKHEERLKQTESLIDRGVPVVFSFKEAGNLGPTKKLFNPDGSVEFLDEAYGTPAATGYKVEKRGKWKPPKEWISAMKQNGIFSSGEESDYEDEPFTYGNRGIGEPKYVTITHYIDGQEQPDKIRLNLQCPEFAANTNTLDIDNTKSEATDQAYEEVEIAKVEKDTIFFKKLKKRSQKTEVEWQK
ncbi:MAG: hypothetical protein HZC26_01690 [Candidatus Magasanikbacteria bacterium]|nr:hypothetical protein [Candidatus Magasanikbacteria bacterium]